MTAGANAIGVGKAGVVATAEIGVAGVIATAEIGVAGVVATGETGAAGVVVTAETGAAGVVATAETGAAGFGMRCCSAFILHVKWDTFNGCLLSFGCRLPCNSGSLAHGGLLKLRPEEGSWVETLLIRTIARVSRVVRAARAARAACRVLELLAKC